MPDAEGPEGAGEQDKLGSPDGPDDKASEGGVPDSEAPEGKAASADAVERLKARAGHRSSRRGGSKRASTRGNRSSRRRLSDEERQAVWQKAVAKKARKIKLISDALIFICLSCVLGAHALPFVGRIEPQDYGPKRGYEIMLDLVKIDLERSAPDSALVGLGTKPLWLVTEGGATRDFRPTVPADPMSMIILVVPVGAVLLLLLYLLDYLVWMGRPLPILSLLYGFGSVTYLMITRVSTNGAWNMIGIGGSAAMTAWFMLLIPLFLLGTFSMLRFLFSARRKRYAFAGKEPPAAPEPTKPAAGKDEAGSEDGSEEETEDASGDKTDDKADDKADGPADAPADGPADMPVGPAAPGARPDALDVTSEARKTPVSSPAIKLNLTGPPDEDDADADAGPAAEADEGPAASPFD